MSEVKPRYDKGGSEFGLMHRELPTKCGMFDIDIMKANAILDLTLREANECFFEYRTNFETSELTVKAMFEIKHKETEIVLNNMNIKIGTSLWAQIEIAKKLNCRFFYVIATEGKQPFKFYEYINKLEYVGTLEYNSENKKENTNLFWQKINLI